MVNTVRDYILRRLDDHDIGKTIGSTPSHVFSTNIDALRRKRAYGIEEVLTVGADIDGNMEQPTPAELASLTEDRRNHYADVAVPQRVLRTLKHAINEFKRAPTRALKDDAGTNYDPRLLNIAGERDIVGSNSGEGALALGLWKEYANAKKIYDTARAGGLPSDIDPDDLKRIASSGAQQVAYRNAVNDGWGEDFAKIGSTLTALIVEDFLKPEYLVPGAKVFMEEKEAKIKQVLGNNYQARVMEVVADTITAWVRSGNSAKEELAAGMFLKAHRGYTPGSRDYSEVFP